MSMLARRLVFLLLLLASLPAAARSDLGIGIKVFEKMQAAQTFLEQDDFDQALMILDEILSAQRLNNYEIAQTLSLKGSVYFQMDDNRRALEMFEQILAYDNIPAGLKEITLTTLAQLTFMQEDYRKALEYGNALLDMSATPDATTIMLIAQIHYRMENYQPALENARRAMAIERELGNKIRENWYLVLNAIYFNLNDYPNMIEVLEELVVLYPRDRYVKNLAAVYGQIEQNERQMLLMEPLYDAGYLARETELVNLANLMMLHNVPHKAAQLIENGFRDGSIERNRRNLELLAQAWQLAAEDQKSVEYFTEAAKLAEDGNLYVSLGQTYMNLYRWKDAAKAFEDALARGGLRKEGDAQLLLGMARFYQKQYLSARKAFVTAKQSAGTEKMADQWLNYMEQEEAKEQAALQLHGGGRASEAANGQ